MHNTTNMENDEKRFTEMMDVFTGLAQATRCCRQDAAFCGGVTFHQYMALDAVSRGGRLRLSDLRGELAVEKSTATRLLKPLLDGKLLKKEPSAADFRAFDLTLTPKGARKHREVKACLRKFFGRIAGHLPETERDAVLQAVRTFIGAIRTSAGICSCCPENPE
ncbi:MAG: winged helix-turn-helix transcriptional regulator [Deltaproteobacteria bacterium]|nr:winged helix-turn-helix transcriptional regulator [Syntrophaceae bacterium]NLX50712.1 winged helix-turn-helix transcriptional regulator [Deltaproteobacteria bacterium]